MDETLRLTPHETLTIRRSTPEVLEVEASYGPSGKPPPPHLHPAQDERFEVLAGTLTARVDGAERILVAGDVLDIPAGTPHQMWNGSSEGASVRWETRPGGRTEAWFRAVDALIRDAGGGMPGPLAFAPLIDDFRDTFRLAVGPDWAVGPAMKALGAVRRLRGRSRPR
jgi:quercetin dioxygenase-like cupin family protein